MRRVVVLVVLFLDFEDAAGDLFPVVRVDLVESGSDRIDFLQEIALTAGCSCAVWAPPRQGIVSPVSVETMAMESVSQNV